MGNVRKKLNSGQSKTVYVLKKGRSIKYPESATKSNLEIILKITLKGTVRVTILIKNYPVHRFEIFNFEQYEMTQVKQMNDAGGHITNLFDEFLENLNKDHKHLLLETTGLYKQQKQILRNVDKRQMLLYVIVNLYGKVNNKVLLVLKSLADIQIFIYLKEINRTSQNILRFIIHAICILFYSEKS